MTGFGTKMLAWLLQCKWSLLSLAITIATQIASRIIVDYFYSRGLWVYRSGLHFKLALTHGAFALVAILLAMLDIKKDPSRKFSYVALVLGFFNLLGTAV